MGMRTAISRSTLAHANEHRDWRIWADFAQALIREAREVNLNILSARDFRNLFPANAHVIADNINLLGYPINLIIYGKS
jgi:hypothetical protein